MLLRLVLTLTVCATPAFARDLLVPVQSSCISSPFGPRVIPNRPQAGTYHAGVDLPAPEGSPVVAAAVGKVMRIQYKALGGLEVLVQHPSFVGVYSHLGTIEDSLDGKSLKAGEKIGTVGNTGVTFGMHLYFAMLRDNQAVDPAPYLTLPMCTGIAGIPATTPRVNNAKWRTVALDKEGKVIPTRHYYLLERNGNLRMMAATQR